MKYIDGFRNSAAAAAIRESLGILGEQLEGRADPVRIMEVCGTHTMAIGRYGIRSLLPKNIRLISGPGCPVCVTDTGYIDAAVKLAEGGAVIASFGDMLKVPGSETNLDQCRSQGGAIHVCYSPLETLELGGKYPDREVVFLAVGFETTVGPVVSIVDQAIQRGVANVSLLTAFKIIPPAMELLASDPEIGIDAFLCPAHVSAIIGSDAYRPVAERYGLPCVVAGFEPLDILLGLEGILKQLSAGESRVENQYSRVVKPEGNTKAQSLIAKYLEVVDVPWRGLGTVPGSGLGLRSEYESFDAAKRFSIGIEPGKPHTGCRCGEVLKGIITPPDCVLFGGRCNPDHPIGPCMVSSEGSCSAYHKYGGAERL